LAVFYRDVVIYDNTCQEAGCRPGRSGSSEIAITPVDGLDAVLHHFCHVRDVEGREEAREDAGGTRTTEIGPACTLSTGYPEQPTWPHYAYPVLSERNDQSRRPEVR
jgi:hypothetical protein